MRGNPTRMIPRSGFVDRGRQPRPGCSSAAGQISKGGDDLRWPVRLGQKTTAFRQIVFPDADEAGGRNDLDRWPSSSDKSGELQTVHGTRHLDIDEDDVNVRARIEFAWSAFAASTTSKAASPIISAAFIRRRQRLRQ
jgi:hypothetical protein